MKVRPALIALAFALALPLSAVAQFGDYALGFSPRTGDVTLDAQLGDINVYARANTDLFVDDVVVSFGAPRILVRELYTTRRWAPGDIYYACALAHHLGRPCLEIVDMYERDHGRGWGVLAQRLGIKPGSAAFHALKGRVGKGHGSMRGNGGARAGTPGGRPGPAAQGGKPKQDSDRGSQGGSQRGGGDDKGGGKGKGRG